MRTTIVEVRSHFAVHHRTVLD